MWKLQFNMIGPDNIQNPARTNKKRARQNRAHQHTEQTIRIQKGHVRDWCHYRNRTTRQPDGEQRKGTSRVSPHGFWYDKLGATLGDALQERTTNRNDQSHKKMTQRHKTGTQIQSEIWKTPACNIGVLRAPEISALLFIIYMGDRIDRYAALNERSRLPKRCAKDKQKKNSPRRLLK